MALEIQLKAIPAQSTSVILSGQNCTIRLYWRTRLYADLDIDGVNIFRGVPCLINQGLKLYRHLPFAGQLMFIDTGGQSDSPDYAELGSRYRLLYLPEDEIESMAEYYAERGFNV